MSQSESVARPTKRTEYLIEFATRDAQKGWLDVLAATRSATVDAWQQLTTDPLAVTPHQYDLKADLATVTTARHGERTQRQIKLGDGSRIWYYVVPTDKKDKKAKVAGAVYLTRVSPGHPKETQTRR